MAQLSAQLSTTAFNTTDLALGAGASWINTLSQFEDVSAYNTVTVTAVADAPSAANGLVCEWSADGITVDISLPFTLVANVPRIIDSAILMKFFRVRYTNGGIAQTRFNVLTVYRYSSSVIIRDIQDGLGDSIMDTGQAAARVIVAGPLGVDNNVTILSPVASGLYGLDAASSTQWRAAHLYPGVSNLGFENYNLLFTLTSEYVFNGTDSERLCTPSAFQTAQATGAGNTALWTPAAGKKFRLLRYLVEVTGNASFAVAAVLTITLFDGAAGVTNLVHDVYIPAIAGIIPGANYNSGWIDLGNGVLSAAANNALNINLSAALATGNVRIIACGTEG